VIHLSNGFALTLESPANSATPNTTFGAAFALGASNVMGSYAQIIDGSTFWPAGSGDGYWIRVFVHSVFVTAQITNAIVTLGIDLAGGTSYTDWISNLLVSGAQQMSGNARYGVEYNFPIRVPNGASIAIKGQTSYATPPANSYAQVQINCKPTRPELTRVGTFVQSFGVDTANSAASAAVTIGGASEGTYVQLGSALNKEIWFWEYGMSYGTVGLSSSIYAVDIALGDASNKRRVIRNARFQTTTSEDFFKYPSGEYGSGQVGDLVYGRCQGATGITGFGLAAYGVGG
jgi:hypothetical protein